MKKNRLIILMQNPKCEICKKVATEIHHKDFSKNNHQLSNLMAVCHSCNAKLRNKPNKITNTKFIRLYEMSVRQISQKIGYSRSMIYQWHYKGILKSLIKSNLELLLNKIKE